MLKKRKNQEEAAANQHGFGGGVGNIFKTIIEGFNSNSANAYGKNRQFARSSFGNTNNQTDGRYQKMMGPLQAFDSATHNQAEEEPYSGPNLLTTPVVKSKRL